LLLLLAFAGVYLPVMGSYGMFDPWETHYTEVARQFMVRSDWLSTYWHNGIGPDGWSETRFWSKPVGSFWFSGLFLLLSGYGAASGETIAMGQIEWVVRLPFVLSAFFGVICSYLMVSRLFSPRAGLFAGIALSTAPMYFFIGRQAMTDMPYVGPMSGGIALFMLAVFGKRETIDKRKSVAFWLFVGAFALFMFLQLLAVIPPLRRVPIPFAKSLSQGVWMALYVVLAGVVGFLIFRKTRTKNEVYLYAFYMTAGIAGLAKGLIGALQPGLVVLVYLVASREWRMLAEVGLFRGLLIAICVAFPWYHGMLLRHGSAFWNEFFGTEQFRRLTIGEQAQAKGTFEYYLSQLGYGLFPWIAFLPAALVRGFAPRRARTPREQALLFVGLWFLTTIGLFTLTMTKYHHYLLPAIPPAAILIGIFLDDLLAKRAAAVPLVVVSAGLVLAIVGFDLVKEHAQWIWMYTYLYNSNWAKGVPQGPQILIYGIAALVAISLLLVPQARKAGAWIFLGVTVALGGYVLNWHQVGCAEHWSQKKVIQSYYKMRKNPEEQIVAWQFNWRGETWYTGAEVVVSKELENAKIQKWLEERKGRRFFFITERYRYSSLRSMLPTAEGKRTLTIVDDSNVHYVLASATI
jgi:4-amino-4-deoxy-L-arabinose transferase-like glycosyltransferase